MRHLSFNVAGCSHRAESGLSAIAWLAERGALASSKTTLEPEPLNQYDKHAVKVFVQLSDMVRYHLGYVPRDKTEQVAQLMTMNLIDSVELESYGRLKKDPSIPRFRVRISHYPRVPGKCDSRAMCEGYQVRMGYARDEDELRHVGENIAQCHRLLSEDKALLRRLYADRLATIRKGQAA